DVSRYYRRGGHDIDCSHRHKLVGAVSQGKTLQTALLLLTRMDCDYSCFSSAVVDYSHLRTCAACNRYPFARKINTFYISPWCNQHHIAFLCSENSCLDSGIIAGNVYRSSVCGKY